eukprot:415076-Prymnesium_polylepis.1
MHPILQQSIRSAGPRHQQKELHHLRRSNKDLLPEPVRAFLRHAYNGFYHDFSDVDVKDAEFHWQT